MKIVISFIALWGIFSRANAQDITQINGNSDKPPTGISKPAEFHLQDPTLAYGKKEVSVTSSSVSESPDPSLSASQSKVIQSSELRDDHKEIMYQRPEKEPLPRVQPQEVYHRDISHDQPTKSHPIDAYQRNTQIKEQVTKPQQSPFPATPQLLPKSPNK